MELCNKCVKSKLPAAAAVYPAQPVAKIETWPKYTMIFASRVLMRGQRLQNKNTTRGQNVFVVANITNFA